MLLSMFADAAFSSLLLRPSRLNLSLLASLSSHAPESPCFSGAGAPNPASSFKLFQNLSLLFSFSANRSFAVSKNVWNKLSEIIEQVRPFSSSLPTIDSNPRPMLRIATIGVACAPDDGRRLMAPDSRKPADMPALTREFAASNDADNM